MLYFAYGSNLLLEQMMRRCPSARVFASKVWLDGYRLTFTGHSYSWGGATATIVPDAKSRVPGAVYEIGTVEDVKRLDAFEACPTVHTSAEVEVKVPGAAERLKVWTYFKREEKTAAPSEEYARTIATGLRQHGHAKRGIDNLVNAMAQAMVRAGVKGYATPAKPPPPKQAPPPKKVKQETAWKPKETRPRFEREQDNDKVGDAFKRLGGSEIAW